MISEWECFSRILLSIGSNEIGLYPDGVFLLADLGTGTTLACFHNLGKFPVDIDRLKSLASEGATLLEVALSIHTHIPSGPLAFDTFKLLISSTISSDVHSKCSGQTSPCSVWAESEVLDSCSGGSE